MINVVGDAHTKLLLHGASIEDSSGHGRTVNNVGVTVSADQSKFGGSSLYFNGSSYLTVQGYDLGAEDFTIDWWEFPTNAAAGTRFTNVYCTDYATQAGGIVALACAGTDLYYVLSSKTGGAGSEDWDVIPYQALGNNVVNSWTHRAIVRSGSRLMFFKNGVLEVENDVGNNPVGYSSDRPWGIGGWADDMMTTGYPYVGYLDEFRVSSVARWTENFTPPTEPYPDSFLEVTVGGTLPQKQALRRRTMMSSNAPFTFEYTGNYTDNRDANGIGTVRFTSSGTLTVLSGKVTVSAYILAGGGGARRKDQDYCTGGGGGYQTVEVTLTKGVYEIVVGSGGAPLVGGYSTTGAGKGGDSSAFGATSTGGYGGATSTPAQLGTGGTPNGGKGTLVYSQGTRWSGSGGYPNGGAVASGVAQSGGSGYVELTFS